MSRSSASFTRNVSAIAAAFVVALALLATAVIVNLLPYVVAR